LSATRPGTSHDAGRIAAWSVAPGQGALLLALACLGGCAGADHWHDTQRRAAESAAEERAAGRVAGSVVDSLTGRPLVGFSVRALGTRSGAVSDANGRFRLALLPPGIVRLRIDGPWSDARYGAREDTLVVDAGVTLAHDFRLARGTPAWAESDSVGVDVPRAGRHLRLDVQFVGRHFRAGDAPRYIARLYYDGPDSIYLQSPVLDGDGARRRNPQVWIRTRTENRRRTPFATDRFEVDRPPPLEESDFYVLHRGEYIFAATTADGDSILPAAGALDCAGMFDLEFHYRTTRGDLLSWLGHGQGRPSRRLAALLRRVPRVDLVAETNVWVDP